MSSADMPTNPFKRSIMLPPSLLSYTQPHFMSVAEAVLRKRKRSSREACEADDNPLSSSKRPKTDDSIRQARRAARERFWDTLSKVWLTPRALREFDRRNAAQSLEQRCTSNLGLRSRKRSFIDTSHLSAASLKDLKRFARRGGPSLVDLRSYPEPSRLSFKTMSSAGSSSRSQKRSSRSSNPSYTSGTGQTLRSSAYDRDFEQKCIDHGIYMPSQRVKPENWQELQERLARSRPSLSPSQIPDEEIEEFCDAETGARDEGDVVRDSLPTILGKNRRDYPSAGNVPFGNMEDMAPDVFKKPKPDLYWGARPAQIDRRVRQDLNSQLVPSTNDSYPAAPNFFLEAKGPDGSSAVKTRQACYDGALGARAMQALQSYGQAEPTYDNKAYTISSTYHDGTLKMYSHHPTQPSHPGTPANYHMTKLGGWELTGSNQTFRHGVGAFRNARDLAIEQRDMLIDRANTVARTELADTMSLDEPNRMQSANMSFDESNSQDTITSPGRRLVESDTSVDESIFNHPPEMSRAKRQKADNSQTPIIEPVEMRTVQIMYRNVPGRQLSLNGQKVFIPDDCWESASRNGRKALYNREKNIFTFIEIEEPRPRRESLRLRRKEPRPMQEVFLSSEGISENVINENIARHCGSDAGVTTTRSKGREGYRIRARVAPSIEDISEMKADTIREPKRRHGKT